MFALANFVLSQQWLPLQWQLAGTGSPQTVKRGDFGKVTEPSHHPQLSATRRLPLFPQQVALR